MALPHGFKTWCENAAGGYRRDLALPKTSPLDPRVLAAYLNITVWGPADIPGLDSSLVRHLTGSESWSAATLRDGDASLIIVNTGHAPTRQNSSIAHEIGHIVLNHEPAKMYVTPDGAMMMSEYNLDNEDEADWFSAAILVPRDALLDLVGRGMDDRDAAKMFGVSLSLYQMRRKRTGIDVQISRRRRRSET
jgi:Zn-dependent peptidase ImmA (M78 family)